MELEQSPAPGVSSKKQPRGPLQRLGMAVGVAAVFGVVGLLLFSGGDTTEPVDEALEIPTPSPPQATPQPTPTPEPSETVESGPALVEARKFQPSLAGPLGWSVDVMFAEAWPVALVEQDGVQFLITTAVLDFWATAGHGLDGWQSRDGTTWESMGTVIPAPNLVVSVTATERGLVAIGNGGSTGSPTVWISEDGFAWSASTLPTEQSDVAGSFTWLQSVGATEDLIVVFGSLRTDPQRAIIDALPEEFRGYAESRGVELLGTPLTVSVQGPLGITL